MKIQIDTTNKKIRLDSSVSLKELIEFLNKILPKEWKEYILETDTVINNFSNPVIIEKHIPVPAKPWYYDNNKYFTGTKHNITNFLS